MTNWWRYTTVVICALFLGGSTLSDGLIRIHLVGDSTMADKPAIDNPERGWGQLLGMFFGEGVRIRNHARNGRSTKSFISEGRWQTVMNECHPGDYVFIQFGHNDEKKEDSARYAPPRPQYQQNLVRFVRETKDRGGIPVLLTPVMRRMYDNQGTVVDTHGDYPNVVREVAESEGVAVIDLQKMSAELLQSLGAEHSKKLFLHVPAGVFDRFPLGKEDDTHFVARGAYAMAALVVGGIRSVGIPLADRLSETPDGVPPSVGKTVTLDYYFNNEWRPKKDTVERFHYVWEDTTNSGFSALGELFVRRGANIKTLKSAPTPEILKWSDVYIIVDPDTPTESREPNLILAAHVEAIAAWVHEGGTLVLMSNDKGNSEFEHFNELASRFGIRFNEDSYHRVVGKEYQMGAFTDLPDHPLFAGTKKIYMKELSSLSVSSPAEPVLSENGKIFIATAKVGKGKVLAIGDPWLYNEYIDSRKLPADFENLRAARNMVSWLLE